MNFSLTPSLEQFIRDQAESGDYNSASEVVREALRLLKRQAEQRALKMDRLRQAVADGDGALEEGSAALIASDAELDALFAEF
ncbi:MAG: type II toxin-antitoxin system ParD family antitoxin [Rhodospirillales bacterium]|jgi:antitoxin ParD1/3/4|nr:type II toxin-antitoxin system ParD family antitoxin [Rhodospirillales bacterium]